VPLLRAGGQRVAAAIAGGEAVAGALPLPDLVAAVADGAPLVAFGALTRRAGGQLVVARDAPIPPRSEALLAGDWRGARVGLTTGSGGSETLMRLWWLAGAGPATASLATTFLERDPWHGEPRWLGFGTGEALVAALKDGRIWAFLGPSGAAAQALLLGTAEVVANVSAGGAGEAASGALPVVLVARRDRLAAGHPSLQGLPGACARAGAALATPDGPALVARVLAEQDALTRQRALRLDVPPPDGAGGGDPGGGESLFSPDGLLPPEAVARYLELVGPAGAPPAVDVAGLVTQG
jgi:ABC-type nitrate/sulfonate/bicarbonate transport system substrate-binding protein